MKKATQNSQLLNERDHHPEEGTRHQHLPQGPASQLRPWSREEFGTVRPPQARAHHAQDNLGQKKNKKKKEEKNGRKRK